MGKFFIFIISNFKNNVFFMIFLFYMNFLNVGSKVLLFKGSFIYL